MVTRMKMLYASTLLVAQLFAPLTYAQEDSKDPVDRLPEMTVYPGYFTFYWDEDEGKIWLAIDKLDQDFLYVSYLSSGLGSNDVGLDRGQIGSTQVVRFQRVGPRVLLVRPNLDYRAESQNPDEVTAVEQAFAKSVLWGFKVAGDTDDGVLVDATDFFLRDAHDVAGTLQRSDQGTFSLESSRSAVNLDRTRNFPQNTEVDALLTFVGDRPGRFVRQVTPDPQAITITQHHSFVQLPDDEYEPRRFDPRAGIFPVTWYDYATPIDKPIEKRFIERHRLRKRNPNAATSPAVEPILYYLDRGTPEPIRSALLDGARWWNQAFEAIGYEDAFRVEMLPEDADMLDVRYNVIQWVHRATRGWSYGSSVVDPRTGEIIKGHVTLGSLRVRQDYLIAQGLTGRFEEGSDNSDQLVDFALARLRQLSAHEVGHTLGFAHNFASSVNGRASVMDYPHPLVQLDADGSISLEGAYDEGIGEWDKVAVAYAYQDFPGRVDEPEALDAIVNDALNRGLLFISDQDARPPGGAHPSAHLWDNNPDAVAELERVLRIRNAALSNFSASNIPADTPMSYLEEVLVPVYFFHRYQTEAAVKLIGGLRYAYKLRGDAQADPAIVPVRDQTRALQAILDTLSVETLTPPEAVLDAIPPRAFGQNRHRELFEIQTGLTPDPVAMAQAAAQMTVELLLHPARGARLAEFHARNENFPGLHEVYSALLKATWYHEPYDGLEGEIHRAVNTVALREIMRVAQDTGAAPQVRDTAMFHLQRMATSLGSLRGSTPEYQAQLMTMVLDVGRFLENPGDFELPERIEPPPGSPIGGAYEDLCSIGASKAAY